MLDPTPWSKAPIKNNEVDREDVVAVPRRKKAAGGQSAARKRVGKPDAAAKKGGKAKSGSQSGPKGGRAPRQGKKAAAAAWEDEATSESERSAIFTISHPTPRALCRLFFLIWPFNDLHCSVIPHEAC